NFLELKNAVIDINDEVITDIIFKAQGKIPINNPGINWGYGIVTTDTVGQTEVIVTTSHPDLPIADSDLQKGDPTDDVIHNHYAILDQEPQGLCGSDPFIVDLTTESPGEIFVKQNKAILKNLPQMVTGGNFNPAEIFEPGIDIQVPGSFQLEYVEDENNPENFAVCVVDFKALSPEEQSTLIVGESDFFDNKKKTYYDEYNKDYRYSEEKTYEKHEYLN
ncbi:MAG: hypothetical protein ACPKQO_11565, partial [Nitrososphaeraceae archaeon]